MALNKNDVPTSDLASLIFPLFYISFQNLHRKISINISLSAFTTFSMLRFFFLFFTVVKAKNCFSLVLFDCKWRYYDVMCSFSCFLWEILLAFLEKLNLKLWVLFVCFLGFIFGNCSNFLLLDERTNWNLWKFNYEASSVKLEESLFAGN